MDDDPKIWEIDCNSMMWTNQAFSRRDALRAGAGAVFGLTTVGSLVGCGGSKGVSASTGSAASASSSGPGGAGAGKTIGLSLNGFNTYDQNTAEGVLKGLSGTGYKLIGAEAGFDASKEVANLKQLIARKPDALIVLAASAEGAARASRAAKTAGIPVVTNIWFPVDKQTDAVYYAACELKPDLGGQLVVDFIAKESGITSGKILEITGLDAQPFSDGYKRGIRKALASYPGLKIAASQQGLYTADGALKALKPMLAAHPDAKVIIDYAAEMGVAIAQELERQGRKDIIHTTSDGNDRTVAWLKKENGAYLKADRWYSPAEQGLASVSIIRNKLEKNEPPTTANVGLSGWSVVEGTSDPVVVLTREAIATAANIASLPPFGYPQFTKKISFGG